jgi:transcriptional regulator with XRE-family HTH domain
MPWQKVNLESWAQETGVDLPELRQKNQLIEEIVNARKALKLTQVQLAKLVGVSQPRIAQIENRTRIGSITFDVLFQILGHLGFAFDIRMRKVKEPDLSVAR